MFNETPIKQRLLITFGKSGALKYTSNLDIAKIWERVLRRANLPLLYSQGFNTRPRIQLASALPLGITSECELLDVSLKEPIDLTDVQEQLRSVSPAGLDIYAIEPIDVRYPALQTLVTGTEYRIHFLDDISHQDLNQRVEALLARDTIIKEEIRKGRRNVTDLRPLIHDLTIDDQGDLIAHVSVGSRGNVRPEDVLRELGLESTPYTVHRQKLELAPPAKL
ncbi:MAG: hypothetical protein CL610_11795 [Anaerolineaceae bacterium]|nr:hypothetical protein [Anaerolineaceae bacterium]